MFNLTGSEIVVILLLALVVLGPEKLPDAIRRFGRTYAELKRMSSGFQSEFRAAIDEPVREMRDTADMLGRSAQFGGDVDVPEPSTDLPFSEPAGSSESAGPSEPAGPAPSTPAERPEPGAGWGAADPSPAAEPDESSGTDRP